MNTRNDRRQQISPGLMMLALVLSSLLGASAKPEAYSADRLLEGTVTELSRQLHGAARRIVDESTAEIKASLAETIRPDLQSSVDETESYIAARVPRL